MKTQPISNSQYFGGYISVGTLGRKKTKVYNSIKEILTSKVEDIDHLVLNINESNHPYIISKSYKKSPAYVVMHTQVKSATVPTATMSTKSTNPQDWLDMVDKLIRKHVNSDFYQETINAEREAIFAILKRNLFVKHLS